MEKWRHTTCTVTQEFVDNGHSLGIVRGRYRAGVAHKDGKSLVGVTGVVVGDGKLLVPSSVLGWGVCKGEVFVVAVDGRKQKARVLDVLAEEEQNWESQRPKRDLSKISLHDPASRLWPRWEVTTRSPQRTLHCVLSWVLLGTPTPSLTPIDCIQSHVTPDEPVTSIAYPYSAATTVLGAITTPGKVVAVFSASHATHTLPCHPSSEGGLVIGSSGYPCGVMLPFTAAMRCLPSLLRVVPRQVPPKKSVVPALLRAPLPDGAVALVRCASGKWGSAVSLGGGRFLTNAHVVKGEGDDVGVKVQGVVHPGRVEFISKGSMDVAMVVVPECKGVPGVDLGTPRVGQRVTVVGFPSGGDISMTHGAVIGLLDTCVVVSAAVRPGASGGLLMSAESGEMLGMATACVWDSTLEVLVPSIGMCLSPSALAPFFSRPYPSLDRLSACYNAIDHTTDRTWQLSSTSDPATDTLLRLHLQIEALRSGTSSPLLPPGEPGALLHNFISSTSVALPPKPEEPSYELTHTNPNSPAFRCAKL